MKEDQPLVLPTPPVPVGDSATEARSGGVSTYMSKLNEFLKMWPVMALNDSDLEAVIIDVTQWEEDYYTLQFNFLQHRDEQLGETRGFTLLSHMEAGSLWECHAKVDALCELGLFGPLPIRRWGRIVDANADAIGEIDWDSPPPCPDCGAPYGEHQDDDEELDLPDGWKMVGPVTPTVH